MIKSGSELVSFHRCCIADAETGNAYAAAVASRALELSQLGVPMVDGRPPRDMRHYIQVGWRDGWPVVKAAILQFEGAFDVTVYLHLSIARRIAGDLEYRAGCKGIARGILFMAKLADRGF